MTSSSYIIEDVYTDGKDLLDTLHDILSGEGIYGRPDNKWESVFQLNNEVWVQYAKKSRQNVQGLYKDESGIFHAVYKMSITPRLSYGGRSYIDEDGFVHEVIAGSSNTESGRKLQLRNFTIKMPDDSTETMPVSNALVAKDEINNKLYLVRQEKEKLDNTVITDLNWNSFRLVGEIEKNEDNGDWIEFIGVKTSVSFFSKGGTKPITQNSPSLWSSYRFTENYYEATSKSASGNTFVLKCEPEKTEASLPQETFYFMAKQPTGKYTYVDFYIGKDFNGSAAIGDRTDTYDGICDPLTVGEGLIPTIINQQAAEEEYLRQLATGTGYTPPKESWQQISPGRDFVSPAAHFFYAAEESAQKRQSMWGIRLEVHMTNSHAIVIIEGDPSPNINNYYKSFAYVGQINPFDENDYKGNFALTVGMGELNLTKTGFTLNDISSTSTLSSAAKYREFGVGTANGMYDISFIGTRSNTPFQAHFPSFLTQLPDYPTGVTPPTKSGELVVAEVFQKSSWTGLYYASPVYVIHPKDGYRGTLKGVVAVLSNNLLDGDELVFDTKVPKPADPTETIKEVYKYVKTNSPVTMFDKSANSATMGIAIFIREE